VSEGSPAEKAGLRQGDVIVAYRGEPVTDIRSFRSQVSLTPPGSREQLTILRDARRKNLTVTIGKLSEDNSRVAALS
jgi:serine protease Do